MDTIKTTKFMNKVRNMNIMNVIRENINMMRTKKIMNTIIIKNITNKTKNTHTWKAQTWSKLTKKIKNRTMKKTWTRTTWTHSKPWKEYNEDQEYHDPNFGLVIKAKTCDKGSGQGKCSMNQTHSHKNTKCERMQEMETQHSKLEIHLRIDSTLLSGFPLKELRISNYLIILGQGLRDQTLPKLDLISTINFFKN